MTESDTTEQPVKSRVIVWFSCGVTSAVAAKLALEEFEGHEVRIIYCDTKSEHEDNYRFLKDCETWYGQEIEVLSSDKYEDIWDVFAKTRYLVGIGGARCTTELKKMVRRAVEHVDDIQVFGFDNAEQKRADQFRGNNIEVDLRTPLLTNDLSKADCAQLLRDAGIQVPLIYSLGYKNANCIGCVKGGQGYWNKIRVDFPLVFARMAAVERDLNVAINKSYAGDGKRKRVFLDELDPEAGNYKAEPGFDCGILCDIEEPDDD